MVKNGCGKRLLKMDVENIIENSKRAVKYNHSK